jgi:hypothetical protein
LRFVDNELTIALKEFSVSAEQGSRRSHRVAVPDTATQRHKGAITAGASTAYDKLTATGLRAIEPFGAI